MNQFSLEFSLVHLGIFLEGNMRANCLRKHGFVLNRGPSGKAIG